MTTRYKLLQTANIPENKQLRALLKERCARDIVYWINNFGYTYDPRCEPAFLPMILFPKQEEFLRFIEQCESEQVDAIVEKSRDAGVTWLCCFFLVHRWLFREGFKGSIGSRKEDLVDKNGDPDCIFHKIKQIVERLPWWMKPVGLQENKHYKHLLLSNPEEESTITGEAGDNMGRGGRASVYVVDEAAFIERAAKVDAALSQNTNFRIYVSTPNGNGNAFAQKRRAALKNPKGALRLFTMHWKDDPRKNAFEIVRDKLTGKDIVVYPWYEKQKEVIRDPVIIAQELDIDYDASVEGVVIPAKYVNAAIDFNIWLKNAYGLDMPDGLHAAGYDVAGEGENDNVLIFRNGPTVYAVKNWPLGDPYTSCKRVVSQCNMHRVEHLNYDADGIGLSISSNLKNGIFPARFEFYGTRGGGRCSNRRWPDGADSTGRIRYKMSKDKFVNPRAENYWVLRERFEKTYEYRVLGVTSHKLEDLISIPDHPMLIQQLGMVLCEPTEDGRIKIESKLSMKDRGEESPDYADALMITFVERRAAKVRHGSSAQENM